MSTARLPIDAAHRAASSDAHAIGAVTGLTDALAGKAAIAHETALTGVHGIVKPTATSIGLGGMAGAVGWADSVAVGVSALGSATSSQYDVAVGRFALTSCRAPHCVGVGYYAGGAITTGAHNTVVGSLAGASITTGASNSVFGYEAARYLADGATANQTGLNGTFIGAFSRASIAGATNETVIGYAAIGGGSNTVRLGSAFVTNWLPGATNVCALGNSTTAFKELYLHDGTDEWKVTINTSGVLTTTKV